MFLIIDLSCYNFIVLASIDFSLYLAGQTDPNWSNFLYDENTNTINLIDFGAVRDYSKDFVDNYLSMVNIRLICFKV